MSYPVRLRRDDTGNTGGAICVWRPPFGGRLDVLCGTVELLEGTLHLHEQWQLLLPASRIALRDGRGQVHPLVPGAIGVVRPLELHAVAGQNGGGATAHYLLVAPETLHGLGEAAEARTGDQLPAALRTVVEDPALAGELRAIVAEPDAALEPRLIAGLARLVAIAGLHASEPGGDSAGVAGRGAAAAGVARVRAYLESHVTATVALDALAAVAGLSRFHLLRLFRAATGLSPHAYQVQLRLARARRLLEQGVPPSHVAYEAGFADQSHLTRRFRAALGVTPAEYARSIVVRKKTAASGGGFETHYES